MPQRNDHSGGSKHDRASIRRTSPPQRSALVFGALASLFFGFWGFFDKLASLQSLYVTNLVVYGVAFTISLLGIRERRRPSWFAIAAGVCGGGINILVLYSLSRNKLVLVYPFVSFGAVFFVLFSFLFLGGKFVTGSKLKLVAGIIVALLGLVLCGIGLSGGFTGIAWQKIDVESISIGVLIAILSGLWVFLVFFTISKKEVPPLAAATWVFAGSFGLAICVALSNLRDFTNYHFSELTMFAILGGLFIYLGEICTHYAFRATPGDSQRLDQSITALAVSSCLILPRTRPHLRYLKQCYIYRAFWRLVEQFLAEWWPITKVKRTSWLLFGLNSLGLRSAGKQT
jgi:drug/metabolite transporter (DMT)-like permease